MFCRNSDQRPPLTSDGRCRLFRPVVQTSSFALRERGSAACGLLLVLGVLGTALAGSSGQRPASEGGLPARRDSIGASSSRAAGPAPLAPGVSIDWGQPAVLVDSEVVLRRGPVEFFACGRGKEHESILRLNASATHIYMALGLIGLNPGHPPVWDDAIGDYGRPAGDLLDITCEWEEDGQSRSADAFEWLREIEFSRRPISRPWVFAGSLRLADGTLAAEQSGAVFAVVDFPDSLVGQTGRHSSSNPELWLEAATDRIPPLGTPVRLVLRPARPREYKVEVDFRGEAFVEGHYVAPAQLADLLLLARQVEPGRVQSLNLIGVLRADEERLRRELAAAGCAEDFVRFQSQPPRAVGTTETGGD